MKTMESPLLCIRIASIGKSRSSSTRRDEQILMHGPLSAATCVRILYIL